LLISAAELLALAGPYVGLVWAVINRRWELAVLYGAACLVLNVFYAHVVRLTYRRFLLRGLWLEPFAVLYDIGLLNYSMLRYEFGEVLWKGRNVCIPVMRVIPHLPPVDR
jgi:hypothetical protein